MQTADSAPISVRFEQTRGDLIALTRLQISQSKAIRRSRLFMLIGIPALCSFVLVIRWPERGLDPLLATSAICLAVAYVVWLLVSWRRYPTKAVDRLLATPSGKRMLGELQLSLSRLGISFESTHSSGKLGWEAVDSVVRTPDRLFLFVAEAAAIIVPRRAFASGDVFEDCVRAVKHFVNEAPAIGQACPSCGYELTGVKRSRCPECGWSSP